MMKLKRKKDEREKKAKIKREVAARQRSFQLLYANDAIWTWGKDLKMIQLYEDLTPHQDYLPRQLKWKRKKRNKWFVCSAESVHCKFLFSCDLLCLWTAYCI